MTLDPLRGRLVTFICWFLPSQTRFSKLAIPFAAYTRRSGYLYLDGSRQLVTFVYSSFPPQPLDLLPTIASSD